MDEITRRMQRHLEAELMKTLATSNENVSSASDEPFTREKMRGAMRLLELDKPRLRPPQFIGSRFCADQEFDFSKCRSPSRAARRYANGVPGNVSVKQVPWDYGYTLPDGRIVMHPDKISEILSEMPKRD